MKPCADLGFVTGYHFGDKSGSSHAGQHQALLLKCANMPDAKRKKG